MGSPFMVIPQLFLSSAVLDACVGLILKVPQSSFMLSIQHFGGLPLCLILCTSPNSAIFGYPLSFILITWPKYLKHHCCILSFISFCRWICFLMSSLHSLSLHVTPRILLRHAISNVFSCCSEERVIVQVLEW